MPKKNPEKFGQIKWPNPNWLGLIGIFLAIIGFLLLPFLIGLPILVLAWLILVFNFFYSKFIRWVPIKYRQAMTEKIQQEYQPYQPAMKSMGSIILDMLKVAGLFFFGGIIAILFIIFY